MENSYPFFDSFGHHEGLGHDQCSGSLRGGEVMSCLKGWMVVNYVCLIEKAFGMNPAVGKTHKPQEKSKESA